MTPRALAPSNGRLGFENVPVPICCVWTSWTGTGLYLQATPLVLTDGVSFGTGMHDAGPLEALYVVRSFDLRAVLTFRVPPTPSARLEARRGVDALERVLPDGAVGEVARAVRYVVPLPALSCSASRSTALCGKHFDQG